MSRRDNRTPPDGFWEAIVTARQVCSELGLEDTLRQPMLDLLDTVEQRFKDNSRGRRPKVPDKTRFLMRLPAEHHLRPAHQTAYDVVDR